MVSEDPGINGIKSDIAEQDDMPYRVTLTITVMVCGILLIYGILNIVIGKYFVGIPETAGGLFIGGFNLYYLLKKKKHIIPASVINVLTIFLSVYLYIDGGIHHTGIFWFMIMPALYLSTMGKKQGGIWIIVQLGCMGTVFTLSFFGKIKTAYDGMTFFVALLVYGALTYLLSAFEISRRRYKTQVNKLETLLPICSYCKKIRDDGGEWHSVDNYLNRKADIDFSHSICPDCLEAHYPDYAERIKNDS